MIILFFSLKEFLQKHKKNHLKATIRITNYVNQLLSLPLLKYTHTNTHAGTHTHTHTHTNINNNNNNNNKKRKYQPHSPRNKHPHFSVTTA